MVQDTIFGSGHAPPLAADTILLGGTVVTMDPANPRASALAIRGERLLAVGADEEALSWAGPTTRRIDLHGRTVTPGLIDGHAHLDREGLKWLYPSLAGCRSIDDVLAVVRREVARAQPGAWIVTMPIGTPPWFFDGPETFAEGRGPTRQELDAAAPHNPVYIRGPWGFWNRPPLWSFANSLALQQAGITRDTAPPTSTVVIERDESGEPTGAFRETHPIPVLELTLFQAVPRFTHADRVAGILEGMRRYAAAGTTSVYEGHGIAAEVLRAYREVWERGESTVRAYLVLSPTWSNAAEAELVLRDWLPHAGGIGFGGHKLRLGGVFVPLGGHPEVAQCARQALPYTAWAGFFDQCFDRDQYRAIAGAVLRAGLRLNTIVSERLDEVLDVLESLAAEVALADRQIVLQHIRIASPDAVRRVQRLGAICTTQPSSYIWKAGASTLAAGADPEHLLPHRDMLAAGLPFALATDNKPYQPLATLWAAVARLPQSSRDPLGPDQSLTREEALRALTRDAARLTFEETVKGSLQPGKLADFVVWQHDPLTVPLDDLPTVEAALTMIGGHLVHQSDI
jgi:predicted amidohydrolase YtcJ